MQDNSKERFRVIGALWIKEKNGKNFLSGKVEIDGIEYPISVFENKKTKDNHPDYRISLDTEKVKAVEVKP